MLVGDWDKLRPKFVTLNEGIVGLERALHHIQDDTEEQFEEVVI